MARRYHARPVARALIACALFGTVPAVGQEGAPTEPADVAPGEVAQPDVEGADLPDVEVAPEVGEPGPEVYLDVEEIRITQVPDHEAHIDVEELLGTPVRLLRTPEGWVSAREPRADGLACGEVTVPNPDAVEMTIQELGSEARRLGLSAVSEVERALFCAYRSRGYIAVQVFPAETDLRILRDAPPVDVRPEDDLSLEFVIEVGVIGDVRSVASGDRVKADDRIDAPQHARIRRQSPAQPGNFINKNEVDRYALFLSRHPGRRVDVAIGPGEERGEATLDYHVRENKPWSVYFQASNTGTDATEEWRQRFGFVHTQLTGRDDIFSIDYITASFSETNLVTGYYETPLGDAGRLRFRLYGDWNEFTAADLGQSGEDFTGDGWRAGGEFIFNFAQHENTFFDAFAGARFTNTSANNEVIDVGDEESYVVPRLGLRMQRNDEDVRLDWTAAFEFSIGDLAGADGLGRLNPSARFQVLKFDLFNSIYMDVLAARLAGKEPTTLAHELVLRGRGQISLGDRLIPTEEVVVGGFFSVRGYPESVTAGDSAFYGTAEYALHLPNLLPMGEPKEFLGRPFRFAPDRPLGRADWDLILRAFLDGARVVNLDREPFESNSTMLSTGVGIELLLGRNLNLRVDWGIALLDIDAQNVKAGSNRFHFLFTALY